jgi:adenine-specific DNA-methyltransferase
VDAARALGAYYTPAALAEPLTRWAVRAGSDSVLDPSCGDGAFLTKAVDRLLELGAAPRRLSDQVAGVDLDPRAVARANGALLSRHPGLRWSRLGEGDFFRFDGGAFDAVIGNPPYVRTQGRSVEDKLRALRAARAAGVDLSADASLWAPFVAAAAALVKPGGRLAMVVPREALFVNYTKPLLAALERRFARVRLLAVDGLWFDGALVKVALLLGEGQGPGRSRLGEIRDLAGLGAEIGDSGPSAFSVEASSSWVWSRVPDVERSRAALASPALAPMSELATLLVGVVTGDVGYFLPPPDAGLPARFLVPAVSSPSELRGSRLLPRDPLPRLLAVPPDYAGGCAPLDRYLATGVARGVSGAYKCRTRKPWYSVRRQLAPPDLFLGYIVKRRPRFSANEAGAHSTNNVHRLYAKGALDASGLAAAACNAATRLSIELLGRISAAGALKIEPGDAAKVLLPRSNAGVPAAAIDAALRAGRDAEAFDLADGWASMSLGWDARTRRALREAADGLRDARLAP